MKNTFREQPVHVAMERSSRNAALGNKCKYMVECLNQIHFWDKPLQTSPPQ